MSMSKKQMVLTKQEIKLLALEKLSDKTLSSKAVLGIVFSMLDARGHAKLAGVNKWTKNVSATPGGAFDFAAEGVPFLDQDRADESNKKMARYSWAKDSQYKPIDPYKMVTALGGRVKGIPATATEYADHGMISKVDTKTATLDELEKLTTQWAVPVRTLIVRVPVTEEVAQAVSRIRKVQNLHIVGQSPSMNAAEVQWLRDVSSLPEMITRMLGRMECASQLKWLYIHGVSSVDLSLFPNLEHFNGMLLTTSQLRQLASLPRLTTLRITGPLEERNEQYQKGDFPSLLVLVLLSDWESECPNTFVLEAPRLDRLELNQFDYVGAPVLSRISKSVTSLKIQVQRSVPYSIASLLKCTPTLRELDLFAPEIPVLYEMPRLKVLRLTVTSPVSHSLQDIRGSQSLKKLYLYSEFHADGDEDEYEKTIESIPTLKLLYAHVRRRDVGPKLQRTFAARNFRFVTAGQTVMRR